MKEVLEKIPQNFDTTDTQFTAFYRENVWMGDVELAFSEAVLEYTDHCETAAKTQ